MENKTIHDRIAEMRAELGISQEEVAEAVGLQRNSISLIETKKRNPSDRTVRDICRKFKVDYVWLTEGTGDMLCESEDSVLEDVKAEYNLSDRDMEIMRMFLDLRPDEKKAFSAYVRTLIDMREEKEET